MDDVIDFKERSVVIHNRLCNEYGCPVPYFHRMDALSELVSALLSHRTKNHDSGKAFKSLKALFPTWKEVRDAPVEEIQAAIRAVTWPEQKAPRIKLILSKIAELHEELSLDFLKDMTVPAARAWLEQLPGIGPKTSAATLSFSLLRMRALPVDSHHFRVAVRLGLIAEKIGEGRSHAVLEAMLPPEWDAQQVFDNHEVMMFHGQRCCYWRKPECERCVLLDLCPTGQARLAA